MRIDIVKPDFMSGSVSGADGFAILGYGLTGDLKMYRARRMPYSGGCQYNSAAAASRWRPEA
jgi:hypothetical protein